MTRAEYEAKYGVKPATQTAPITMTRAEYQAKYGAVEEPPSEVESYGQRVASEFARFGSQIQESVQQGAEAYRTGVQAGTAAGQVKATGGLLRAGLRTVGNVAGAALSPIFEAPVIKQATEALSRGITKIPGATNVIGKVTDLAKKNPEVAKDVESIINILTLGGGSAATKPIVREAGAVAGDIARGAKIALSPSEEVIQKNVVSLFEKSIKPTAQKTVALKDRYDTNILTALRTIKSNADKLNIEDVTGELTARTPRTIEELAQGVEQTKKLVFTQYDDLAKQAGQAGARIKTQPIADELVKVAESKALQITNPAIIDFAKGWEERLRAFGDIDAETAQEVIRIMNDDLKAFYRNPTYDTASKAAITAGIANNFRKALDVAIENATGAEYQALKNQYAALKAIENDVVRAAMREGRKNARGLLDYTDIFTGGQMVGGILSLSPAMFTKGAIERGLKEYIKYLNDPNRAIENIFDVLDTPVSGAFIPSSSIGQFLSGSRSSSVPSQ